MAGLLNCSDACKDKANLFGIALRKSTATGRKIKPGWDILTSLIFFYDQFGVNRAQ